MIESLAALVAGGLAAAAAARAGRERWMLSRAKYPSLAGHPRLSQLAARVVPPCVYDEDQFFRCDGAPSEVVSRRRAGFVRLSRQLKNRAPETIARGDALAESVSDVQFTTRYRVPFQFARHANEHLKLGPFAQESCGVFMKDLDGNLAYDVTGLYGVNLFGHDFYKSCIDAGVERVRALGPVLGAFHPIVQENVDALRRISGLDEVSFHMSGTEAVMQAVRLARYHTGRSHVVRFCGAYHGWWDGVQAGVGNPRPPRDVYTLRDMDDRTLRVLRSRRDIACVLVNALQALHPNAAAPSDATLVAGGRRTHADRAAYSDRLRRVRDVCTARSIPLIVDDVFLGFRVAYGGTQEYFGVEADMVTYGKTVGGGLPVGVLCGKRDLMRRFRDDRPSDICFARGTFNSHPYVMGAMHEFLRRLDQPLCQRSYSDLDRRWAARAQDLNARLAREGFPLSVAHLVSVWTMCHLAPSRYNWMLQYYLRAEGLALSWIGSARLIFSHNFSDDDFRAVADRIVAAARRMQEDGWWWHDEAATNATIGRRLLREMAAAAFDGYATSRSTIGSYQSPRSR